MPIASGVFKKVALKRQTALGVIAAAGPAGSAQYMRRTSSTFDLSKASYGSAEINTSQQVKDLRHGVRSVTGSLSGELSLGSYQLPFESVLRGRSVGAITTGAINTVAIASDGAGSRSGTFTRSAGNYLTDGFKLGMIVRMTGSNQAANNNKNFLITGLTATVMSVRTLDGSDLVAAAAGANLTIQIAGKRVVAPVSNHYRDYYTLEHWHSDVSESEVFRDIRFTGFTLTMPGTGMATVEFPGLGLDAITGDNEYFTTPTAENPGATLAAANGVILVNGVPVADVTSMTVTAAGADEAPGGVVGSNVDPDIIPGILTVTGSMSVLFRDGTLRDMFYNETEFSVYLALTGDNTPNSGVMVVGLPRVKATGASKDDGQGRLTQTMPFQALQAATGGAGTNIDNTTIIIQDTTFV